MRYNIEYGKVILLLFIALSIFLILTHKSLGFNDAIYPSIAYGKCEGQYLEGFYDYRLLNINDNDTVTDYYSNGIWSLCNWVAINMSDILEINKIGVMHQDAGTYTGTIYVTNDTTIDNDTDVTLFTNITSAVIWDFNFDYQYIWNGSIKAKWIIIYATDNTCGFGCAMDMNEIYINGSSCENWIEIDGICNGYNQTINYTNIGCAGNDTLPNDTGNIKNCSCEGDWHLLPQPCHDGVKLYLYDSYNGCHNNIPLNNGTYQDCILTTIIKNESLSFWNNFTWIDILFIIIIGITLYFPFYMNNKKWFRIYIVSGCMLGLYTIFLTNMLNKLYADNTAFVLILRILLCGFSGFLILYGLLSFSNKDKGN